MTDLRDKIAAVQREHRLGRSAVPDHDPGYICECGWRSPEPDCTWTDHPEHVADAVIRELGCYEYAVATADMEFICMYVNERSELDGLQLYPDEQIVRRYVTKWETERDQ